MKLVMKHFVTLLSTVGLCSVSNHAAASAFQIWEQDVTNIENFHAGYAILAQNASIAFYNPAGITLFKNQQLVFGAVGAFTDIQYNGTIMVNTLNSGLPQPVVAQGGGPIFIPDLSYVAPITDTIGFGLTVVAPFGLQTNYGSQTILRYASTLASTKVVDISPSLGIQVNDKLSFGAGLDAQKMNAEFDLVGVSGEDSDTPSTNKGNDTAYGYHVGGLYQFTPDTRVGLSYHSKVSHHLKGTSKFVGPIADAYNDGPLVSTQTKVNIPLPAYTALSGFHHFTESKWSVMGSVIYTQWSVIKDLVLQNVAGIIDFTPSTTINVVMPQNYSNTWSVSVGTDYAYSDKLTLRSGVGFDDSPVQLNYRTVQLPDENRYAVGLGGHYQASKTIGLDLGWTHLFVRQATIQPPLLSLQLGDEQVTTVGYSNGGADIVGLQLTWDLV